MPSILSTLVSFTALSTCVLGIDLYSYLDRNCEGPFFHYTDIQPNVCALAITRANTSVKEAIALGLTNVHSGKIILKETELDDNVPKSFIGWDAGPKNNTDGPLQCGNVVNTKTPKKNETCMSVPAVGFTGFSWMLKKDKPSKGYVAEPTKRDSKAELAVGVSVNIDIEQCKEKVLAKVFVVADIRYDVSGLSSVELQELVNLAKKHGDLSAYESLISK